VPDGGGCIGVTRELLTNGSFEQGETGWAVSVAGGFPIVYAADGNAGTNMPEIAAQSAPNLTWIGGYNRADDGIIQSVTLPANATSMTLSFFYSIFTRETASVANDVMDVTVVAGTQTLSLAHFSNLDVVHTWTRLALPLPSNLAGQTVSVRFHGTTNATLFSSFYIDTLSLSVVACP
jgi:kumamolisin